MTNATPATISAEARARAPRLGWIDDVRGLAVLAMVLWHTTDGWLRPDLRESTAWTVLHLVGGLAAPAFFTLAGAGAALRLGRDEAAMPAAVRSLVGRGLTLVAGGYGLRLQMWLLDSGALVRPASALVWVPELLAIAIVWLALRERAPAPKRPVLARAVALVRERPKTSLSVAGLLFVAAFLAARAVEPSRVQGLVRVDVLQGIGASLTIVGALGGRVAWLRRPGVALLVALGSLAITKAVAEASFLTPPNALTAYLARGPLDGPRPLAMFPLLPWIAYVWIGFAAGRALVDSPSVDRIVIGLTAVGVVGALVARDDVPAVHRLVHDIPILETTVRATFRTGAVFALFGPAFLMDRLRPNRILRALGRASLLVYWVHLEFAFGTMSKPFHHALTFPGWALGTAILVAAMTGLALARTEWHRLARAGTAARRNETSQDG